ncbi:MAG: serine/threonine-protein kinase, partial [Planctomycetota bacterium]
MTDDDRLDQAIGDWLLRKEAEPSLLPGEFAHDLPEPLRSVFLRELEAIAEVDGLTIAAPSRDLPRRFGDFRVLGELGRGAMGAVYDAEQVSTGRRVALKVVHPHVARDLSSAARFQREARTAAALQHPGIVPVLGFGETDGAAWLAMARIEGRSLQRLLAAVADPRDVDHDRAKDLFREPRRLAQALAEAADALEFAHRDNVVHRDVKPANLMVTDEGRVVVLDFGLATAREPDAPTLTRTGDFLGTPLYMAPEQAVGAQNGTPASDVYALGAVLYECLCGATPVASGPLATVLDAILNRDPVDPRRRRAGVPDELARIALQCLEKEPARRYASAGALADDLRRFVDGSGVHARRSGVLGRSLRRLR